MRLFNFFNRRSLFNMYCCPWCVVCVSLEKCKWCLIGRATRDIVEEVIEVDELDKGSISTAAGKRDQ